MKQILVPKTLKRKNRVKPEENKKIKKNQGAICMRWINYQVLDAVKKLSRYQTIISQIYVRIFYQCTKTKYQLKRLEIFEN
jgi:hypothetical protein